MGTRGGYVRDTPIVHVRLLQEDDLEEVIAIWHESRKETHTAIGIAMERVMTLEESSRIFREAIAPRCEIWLAE